MKKLSLIAVFLLIAVFSVSALVLTPASGTITVDQGDSNTITFDIENDGSLNYTNVELSFDATSFQDADGNQVAITFNDNNFALANGLTETITVTATTQADQYLGELVGDITIVATKTDATTETQTYTLHVDVTSDYFRIEIDEDDLEELRPGEDFTVQVEIDNLWSEDLENVEVKVWVQDIDDNDDLDEKSSKTDIDEGDEETFDLDFTVPLNVDEDKFDLKIKVTGEDADTGDDYEVVQIFRNAVDVEKDEDEEVNFEKFDYPNAALTCGSIFTVGIDAINTGQDDLNDMYLKFEIEGTSVSIRSEEFDLDADKTSKRDESIDFLVTLPEGLDQTSYNIKVLAYNDGNDLVGGEYATLTVTPCDEVEQEEQDEADNTFDDNSGDDNSNDDNTVYLPTGFASAGLFSSENLSLVFWGLGIIALLVIIVYFATLLFKKK
jgi:uncharacterized membrane protein